MGVKVAIIGAGAVGTTFAVALQQKGYKIVGVASRTIESATRCGSLVGCTFCSTDLTGVARAADVIFISTPDEVIKGVCDRIAAEGGFRKGDIVIHLSGALSSDILYSAKRCGASTLALHPIQSFPKGKISVQNLFGSYFSLEGDEEAQSFGRQLVRDLGGKAVAVCAETKPVYHAALCVVSNYLVAIAYLGVRMLERIGIEREDAVPMIMPLIQGTVGNLEKIGLPDALTGPISRGDLKTVEGHLKAIERLLPEYLDIYKKLGELTAEIARQKGGLKENGYQRLKGTLLSIGKEVSE